MCYDYMITISLCCKPRESVCFYCINNCVIVYLIDILRVNWKTAVTLYEIRMQLGQFSNQCLICL